MRTFIGERTGNMVAVLRVRDQDWQERDVTSMVPNGGPEWGYGGTGPHNLARWLLKQVLGIGGDCPACNGTSYLLVEAVPQLTREGCWHCWRTGDSPIVAKLALRFKQRIIAALPRESRWELTDEHVLTWVADPELSYDELLAAVTLNA